MAVRLFRIKSLRARLMLLVSLAIAPTAAMTIFNGLHEHEHAIRVAEENLQQLTKLAAANEAQSLKDARQILQDLSSVPELLAGPQRCSALLAAILRKNAGYINFGLIERNGDVSCSAVPLGKAVNLADRSHFKRAISERRFIASNYVFGRVTRKHTINLTYPVTDGNNEVVAVVFAALDLVAFDKFISDIDLPPGSMLLTADGNGTIIARRPDPPAWFGKTISDDIRNGMASASGIPTVATGGDGVERLHTFARVGPPELSDYTLTIGVPHQAIVATAKRDQMRGLIGLLATCALALVASWFVGEVLIVRRIRRLAATADRIASGSLGVNTGLRHGNEEIGQLARSIDEMAAALQQKEAEHLRAEGRLRAADKRKDEFLAMLAHELRNPLAPISTGAQLLKLAYSGNPSVARTADIISRQVDHMTRLVDDLLDVSRVTRGLVILSKEMLDLKDIVSDAMEQVQPLMTAKGHVVELHLTPFPAPVYGDRKRLVQVAANLLNNAGKYTPDGGSIHLDVDVCGDELLLCVSDNGIGMGPELVGRVFELFAQAERTPDRSQGGLGLGLALVKSLVELHGGTALAYSDGNGQGSKFTVRLPRAVPEPGSLPVAALPGDLAAAATLLAAVQGVAPGGEQVSPLRFLLVDDNADAVHTLQQFLTAAGHEVTVAFRASDGLELALATSPQVCLLDIGLPDYDGNELARRLRAHPETEGAVLVAVSGYGRREDRDNAVLAGFDHYFVKPLETAKLMALLAELRDSRGFRGRQAIVPDRAER
jgi:signal transduction histidine kinase/ActR/RegA family two-component response regulator